MGRSWGEGLSRIPRYHLARPVTAKICSWSRSVPGVPELALLSQTSSGYEEACTPSCYSSLTWWGHVDQSQGIRLDFRRKSIKVSKGPDTRVTCESESVTGLFPSLISSLSRVRGGGLGLATVNSVELRSLGARALQWQLKTQDLGMKTDSKLQGLVFLIISILFI